MLEYFENNRRGIIGTTIFHVVIALIIIFLGFSTPLPLPGEEGIIINFGTDDDGLGFTQPARQPSAPPSAASPPATETVTEEDIITQDIEEAPSLPSVREEQIRQPEPVQPAQERQPAPVEETPREEVAEEVPERVPNPNALFPGRTTTGDPGASEGATTGAGDQGRETGDPGSPHRIGGDTGSPDGISFSLEGRSSQSLPPPDYRHNVEGVVVVQVRVNRNGEVTSARPGVQNSTTMDERLLNAAREAAMKARFNPSPGAAETQVGTITYHFRFQ